MWTHKHGHTHWHFVFGQHLHGSDRTQLEGSRFCCQPQVFSNTSAETERVRCVNPPRGYFPLHVRYLCIETSAEPHVRPLNSCLPKYYLPDQVPLAFCPFPWGSCPFGPASGRASVLAFGPSVPNWPRWLALVHQWSCSSSWVQTGSGYPAEGTVAGSMS